MEISEPADRRLRAAAHEFAGIPTAGDWAVKEMTSWGLVNVRLQPVRLRPRRAGRTKVLHDGDDTRRQPAGHRRSAGVDVEHRWRRVWRRRASRRLDTPEDLATWKGKLKGKFVLLATAMREVPALFEPRRSATPPSSCANSSARPIWRDVADAADAASSRSGAAERPGLPSTHAVSERRGVSPCYSPGQGRAARCSSVAVARASRTRPTRCPG